MQRGIASAAAAAAIYFEERRLQVSCLWYLLQSQMLPEGVLEEEALAQWDDVQLQTNQYTKALLREEEQGKRKILNHLLQLIQAGLQRYARTYRPSACCQCQLHVHVDNSNCCCPCTQLCPQALTCCNNHLAFVSAHQCQTRLANLTEPRSLPSMTVTNTSGRSREAIITYNQLHACRNSRLMLDSSPQSLMSRAHLWPWSFAWRQSAPVSVRQAAAGVCHTLDHNHVHQTRIRRATSAVACPAVGSFCPCLWEVWPRREPITPLCGLTGDILPRFIA